MIEIDPGHEYLLDSYDGGESVRLTFVKREGEGYPFNVGHHPGTNCQETYRALIKRIQHLQLQEPCDENLVAVNLLRCLIWLFETRAANRHNRQLTALGEAIELLPTCKGCGHIGCEGNHKATQHADLSCSQCDRPVPEHRVIDNKPVCPVTTKTRAGGYPKETL